MGASGELGSEGFARQLLGMPTAAGQRRTESQAERARRQVLSPGQVMGRGLAIPYESQVPRHDPPTSPLGSVRGAQARAHDPHTSRIGADPALPAARSPGTRGLWSV